MRFRHNLFYFDCEGAVVGALVGCNKVGTFVVSDLAALTYEEMIQLSGTVPMGYGSAPKNHQIACLVIFGS